MRRALVNEYLAETEAAMTKADTGEFLFDDLRELAANHAQQKIEFEKLIPENISLGLFVVGGFLEMNAFLTSDTKGRLGPPPRPSGCARSRLFRGRHTIGV